MRADLPIAVLLLAASALPGAAQAPPRPGSASPATVTPIIACASLANLRSVLRGAKGDPTAAIPVITDPKSDLGCTVLDTRIVIGIADHVALNGSGYECLSLQNTSICQWTVAGSAVPVSPKTAPAPAAGPQGRSKR